MNPINMTGEPNQQTQTHPSVFSFDPYPSAYPISWNVSNPFANSSSQSQINPVTELSPQVVAQNQIVSQYPAFPSGQAPQASPLIQQPQPQAVLQSHTGLFQVSQPQSSFSFGTAKPVQEVVQFPFQLDHGFGQRNFGFKRKTDSPPLQHAKQHITEEKMVEHMSKLHISSATASAIETDSSRMQRLYLCEEMRKLQSETIIPQSLLSKMQQPCKALVLWKPPARLVPLAPANERDENENNNGESVPDSNVVGMESEMNELVVNNMDMDNC